MLQRLENLSKELTAQGLSSSYTETEDEVTLCWFDFSNSRNSISIWLDDFEGIWSIVKNGQVMSETEFDNLEEFIEALSKYN